MAKIFRQFGSCSRWSGGGESVGLLIMGSRVRIRMVHLLTSFVSWGIFYFLKKFEVWRWWAGSPLTCFPHATALTGGSSCLSMGKEAVTFSKTVFPKPDAVLVWRFTQPYFSLAHKIDGPSFPYYCAIFSEHQVWWRSENSCCLWKDGELSCRLPKYMCQSLRASFWSYLYFTNRRHFLLPSITLVLASDSRDHDSILKAEWPKNFSSRNRPF